MGSFPLWHVVGWYGTHSSRKAGSEEKERPNQGPPNYNGGHVCTHVVRGGGSKDNIDWLGEGVMGGRARCILGPVIVDMTRKQR